jgi:CRISPR-associated protein Csb2
MTLEARKADGPAAFVWTLSGAAPPSLARALTICHAARSAIMRTLDAYGVSRLPDWLHHAGEKGDSAYWIALDPDNDGRIDQVACVRPGGLGFEVLPGFSAGGDLWVGEGRRDAAAGRWRMSPDTMGPLVPGGLIGPARHWMSLTPFVASRETIRENGTLRANRSLDIQLRDDLVKRGLVAFGCEPIEERATDAGRLAAADFELVADDMRPPPQAPAAFARLAFAEPIDGLLTLGYGAHYGLGLFLPVA